MTDIVLNVKSLALKVILRVQKINFRRKGPGEIKASNVAHCRC